MGKSIQCSLLITFLVIICLTFPNIQSVSAESSYAIYIRADGSIDPPTVNITTFDNITYTFTDNNIGGITVERDNIILDGADHVLEGYFNLYDPLDPDTIIRGIVLASNNVTIQNLNIVKDMYGILVGGTDCVIRQNEINTNGPYPFPTDFNIVLAGHNNLIADNILNGYIGIRFGSPCSGNNILRNKFYNAYALDPETYGYSANDTFTENDFRADVIVGGTSNDTFYHNNFYYGITVHTPCDASWNESYPSGGNYWSGYTGTDVCSGPYQNETGSDGIGDTPKVLCEGQIDNYPLMCPWTMIGENITSQHSSGASITFREVTAGGITWFNEETGPDPPQGYKLLGYCFAICTTAAFSGNIEVTFPYGNANLTLQEEKNLKMMQWNEITLTWTNITTNVDTTFYKVTGQTTYLSIFGVMWRLGGDVNGDFTVDIFDAILLAGSFNSTPESGSWNPNADLNNDNVIDIYDAIILAANFGRH